MTTYHRKRHSAATVGWILAGMAACLAGCTPRVEVAAPEKPITINLNVKIDHEIRVKVDKELDRVLSSDSGLF
ncbi:MAG: YnbE family lipoprotein [Nitrospira sp.]|nr:YnbE family lipoprotein [Nitrospira sp.]